MLHNPEALAPDQPNNLLIVRQKVKAPVERVFRAWTEPEQIRQWWGPQGVSCPEVEIDLQEGGGYRIANALPDGTILWISGVFTLIDPPHRLVYTWQVGETPDSTQQVTVRFESQGDETEVIVLHELIPTKQDYDMHLMGWIGCLAGLEEFLGG